MQGKEVFRFAVDRLSRGTKSVLKKHHIATNSIDLVIPHQANTRILDQVTKFLNLERAKVVTFFKTMRIPVLHPYHLHSARLIIMVFSLQVLESCLMLLALVLLGPLRFVTSNCQAKDLTSVAFAFILRQQHFFCFSFSRCV